MAKLATKRKPLSPRKCTYADHPQPLAGLFQTISLRKTSGIRTRIVRIEGKHVDRLTTNTSNNIPALRLIQHFCWRFLQVDYQLLWLIDAMLFVFKLAEVRSQWLLAASFSYAKNQQLWINYTSHHIKAPHRSYEKYGTVMHQHRLLSRSRLSCSNLYLIFHLTKWHCH